MEGVKEDRIYRICPSEAQWIGKTEGEGGRHDVLAATENNAHAFFSRPVSGVDEEEQNEPVLEDVSV